MKSLYESILDSDEKVKQKQKTGLIREIVRIILEIVPEMHILFTPNKDYLVGECKYTFGVHVYTVLKQLNQRLKELLPGEVSYNSFAEQIHLNVSFENDLIRISFFYSRDNRDNPLIRMSIGADKTKTLNVVKKIFDKKVPF